MHRRSDRRHGVELVSPMSKTNRRTERLQDRVALWAARLKVKPRLVRIQRMTRKWGSCSTAGTITLAADLNDQGVGFQDFVIAHELLHLRVLAQYDDDDAFGSTRPCCIRRTCRRAPEVGLTPRFVRRPRDCGKLRISRPPPTFKTALNPGSRDLNRAGLVRLWKPAARLTNPKVLLDTLSAQDDDVRQP